MHLTGRYSFFPDALICSKMLVFDPPQTPIIGNFSIHTWAIPAPMRPAPSTATVLRYKNDIGI